MRAKEFIVERKFKSRKANTLSTAYEFPSMPGDSVYRLYRFGLAMANPNIENAKGPAGNHAVVVAYMPEEEATIQAASKKTGNHSRPLSNKGSTEPTSTDHVSPVAKSKRNRYGV
jgi:hypothetical protein